MKKILISLSLVLVASAIGYETIPYIKSIAMPVSVNDIAEVENHTSTVKKKWVGLCEKNQVKSVKDFKTVTDSDPVLKAHYADFQWNSAEIKTLAKLTDATVAHRLGADIRRSKKKILLPQGDMYITDGKRNVRMFCCNDFEFPEETSAGQEKPPTYTTYEGTASSEIPYVIYGYPIWHGSNPSPSPNNPVTETPEPSTLILFGFGLLMFLIKRK